MEARQLTPSDRNTISPERYLALERQAETKSEYWDGEIVAMTGASHVHNLITPNLVVALYTQVVPRGCQVYSESMRLRLSRRRYVYPDVMVVCGMPELVQDNYQDTLLNPIVIIEVLSPSTEMIDRGRKLNAYRQIPSVRDYIMVEQSYPSLLHYSRQTADLWLFREVSGLDAIMELTSIGCSLALADVYRLVTFPDVEDDSHGEI